MIVDIGGMSMIKNKKAFICSILLAMVLFIGSIFLIAFGPESIVYFFSGYGVGTIIIEITTILYTYILRKESDKNE